ncbi:MAG: hypothetical protein KBF37_07800 [Saprospiraceae bacterium]|jgi:hypothetical protein|nr:hypothetical protein [Saprospiraceae bacterium]MBP9210206.1 hypothetical protein [Saprospiraceae bacterium]
MDFMQILINTVAGAAGGYGGNMAKKNGLGMIGNLIAGAAGGNILPILAQALNLLGNSGGEDGGFNIMGLILSLVGGGAGSLLGGLFKKAQ